MRPALEKILQFLNDGCVNLDACQEIENNYDAVILRFFEGDVPMMICSGDTVSGTKKREERSEAFIAAPFAYSFAPVPISDEGISFLDQEPMLRDIANGSHNSDRCGKHQGTGAEDHQNSYTANKISGYNTC